MENKMKNDLQNKVEKTADATQGMSQERRFSMWRTACRRKVSSGRTVPTKVFIR